MRVAAATLVTFGGLLCVTPLAGQSARTSASIQLRIDNGPHADTYAGRADDATCTLGVAGPDLFIARFGVDFPAHVMHVALAVPDARAAADGTGTFRVEVTLADLLVGRTIYTVETRAEQRVRGSGRLTLAIADATATISFTLRTPGGIGMAGTVICRGVIQGKREKGKGNGTAAST